jgi:hypothetical protein
MDPDAAAGRLPSLFTYRGGTARRVKGEAVSRKRRQRQALTQLIALPGIFQGG